MRLFRIVTVCLLALTAPAFAAENPEFPIEGLERRVEFWKKAFTQYGKDDLIIHDRNYVNLIYECASDRDLKAKLRAVRDAFQRRGIVKMKADWTNGDPAITKILKQFGRPGVPLYVLYPGSNPPVVFPELLTQNIVLEKLETITPHVALE